MALKGMPNDPRTPGMLGTGGFQPDYGDSLPFLHQRAQAHEDDYYAAEHERDLQPGADPQLTVAHRMNEGQSRINNMNAGGWGDWLYAFNEATGGKGKFAPGTSFTGSGGKSSGGGTMARRPSMAALSNDDPNDFVGRMQANYDEHPLSGEQQRQARILNDMDTRTEVGIRGDLANSRENFDINSGQAAARAQGVGDIRRQQSLQDARQGSENYFDPEVARQREAQFGEEMSRLRARYTDPAITKGINDSNVAMIRGQYGLGRQDLINAGVLDRTAITDATARRGQDVSANSRVAAAGASMGTPPGPNRDFSNDGPPPDPRKVISRQELADYASQNNISLTDAMAQARAGRYTIQ